MLLPRLLLPTIVGLPTPDVHSFDRAARPARASRDRIHVRAPCLPPPEYAYVHVHVNVYVYPSLCLYLNLFIHSNVDVYSHMYTYVYMRMHMHVYMYVYMYTYTRMYVYVYVVRIESLHVEFLCICAGVLQTRGIVLPCGTHNPTCKHMLFTKSFAAAAIVCDQESAIATSGPSCPIHTSAR